MFIQAITCIHLQTNRFNVQTYKYSYLLKGYPLFQVQSSIKTPKKFKAFSNMLWRCTTRTSAAVAWSCKLMSTSSILQTPLNSLGWVSILYILHWHNSAESESISYYYGTIHLSKDLSLSMTQSAWVSIYLFLLHNPAEWENIYYYDTTQLSEYLSFTVTQNCWVSIYLLLWHNPTEWGNISYYVTTRLSKYFVPKTQPGWVSIGNKN